ncbi:MAG: AAA family ATPase [Clostridia bacterium]|nr:AAA family ATPase [Clostridia bacterium]
MKIKELYIRNFGKFRDYRLVLNDGVNVLFGSNEAGKTTLFSFIFAMLYGFSNTRGKNAADSARKKYITWGEDSIGGTMTIEFAENTYVINRTFGRTKAGDSVEFVNLTLGQKVSLPSDREVGEYLFDIDERAFKGTCLIGQLNKNDVYDNDSVKTKLSNLSSAGDAGYSFDVVFGRLKNLSSEITKKTPNGKIYPLEIEKQSLENDNREIADELLAIDNLSLKNAEHETEKKKLEKELMGNRNLLKRVQKNEAIKKYRDALELNGKIDRYSLDVQEKKKALTNKGFVANREYVETLRKLKSDCDSLQKEREYVAETVNKRRDNYERLLAQPQTENNSKFSVKWTILSLVLTLIVCAVLSVVLRSITAPVIVLVCGILISVCIGFVSRDGKKNVADNSEEIRRVKAELDLDVDKLRDAERNLELSYSAFKKQYLLFFEEEEDDFELCIKSLCTLLDDYSSAVSRCDAVKDMGVSNEQLELMRLSVGGSVTDDAEILSINVSEIEERKEKIVYEISRIDKMIALNNERLKKRGEVEKRFENNSMRIREIDDKIRKYEYESQCIELAKRGLENAQISMQKQFAPNVSRLVSEILGGITDGKYEQVSLNGKLETVIVDSTGAAREDGYMSAGTLDQIYLSLRLALIKTIFDGREYPVICMDDALVNFDSARMKRAAKYISRDFASKSQILFFTCRENERDCFFDASLVNL